MVATAERTERRASVRASVALPTRLRPTPRDPSLATGETVDVSWGGCRVVTDRPWPEDSNPVVTVDLSDGYPMVSRARVVTVNVTGDGWEYRLAFAGIADDDRARLLRLIRRRWAPGPNVRQDLGLCRDFGVVDGVVEAIFVAAASGRPMRAVDDVEALAGCGLAGDRYCTRRGYWTGVDECQVTFIEGEDLDYIAAEHGVPVAAGRHRRNIVTRGLDLADVEGRRFTIGDAVFEFDQPRPPCRYIASLTEGGMTRALGGRRGGIGARVLRSGTIRVGEPIEVDDDVTGGGR